MPRHVFVYGTLLVPEMMQAVTGCEHQSLPATVRGFYRRTLTGRTYPGIAVQPQSSVEGRVYIDVDDEAVARLDYFEGPEYVRQTIEVGLDDGTTLAADAYIVPEVKRHLMTDQPWQLEEFIAAGLYGFLQHAREAMQAYRPGTRVDR